MRKKQTLLVMVAVILVLAVGVGLLFRASHSIEGRIILVPTMGYEKIDMLRHFLVFCFLHRGDRQEIQAEDRRLSPSRYLISVGTQVGVLEYRGVYARVQGISPYFPPVWVPIYCLGGV